jgi:antitoxin CptB
LRNSDASRRENVEICLKSELQMKIVMVGPVPAIHVFLAAKTWMPETSPGMAMTIYLWSAPFAEHLRERRADILHPERYINPARHVRAFGVGMGIDMTGSTRSSGGLDDRRKRLLFRCWHRGTREMDLILGRFADAEIATLSDDELAQLEHLIEVPDPDLYAALTGNVPLAPEYASRLFDRIKSFRVADHDA